MNTILLLLTNMLSNKYSKYIVGAIVLLFGYWYHHYQVDNAYQGGYTTAEKDITEKYKALEQDIQNKLNLLTIKHQQEVNQLQNQMSIVQSEYQKQYEKGKQDAEQHANRIIDEYRNGNHRLSIETQYTESRDTKTGATPNTPSVRNTTGRTPLSERSTRFLIQQATSADNTLRELNLCKQTLWETRRTISLYNQTLNKTP